MAGRKSKNPNPKPLWTVGKELPPFSGKNWWELEDIYPRDQRINNEIWKVIGLMGPAWLISKQFCKDLTGETIRRRDFELLCYMQRCEEARDNVGMDTYALVKGLTLSGTILHAQKAKIQKLGLVERLPVPRMRIYRVTQKGKLLIKNFHDNLRQANDNLAYWISLQNETTRKEINRLLCKHYPGFGPKKT